MDIGNNKTARKIWGSTDIEVELRAGSIYMLRICLNRKKVCTRIVMFDRHAVENTEVWGLAPRKIFEATPSGLLENALFAK